MPRPKKGEKTLGSGRKKGTPNKRTQDLQKFFEEKGVNLPEMVLELLPELKPNDQAKTLLELMSFVYPRRKAIDFKADEDTLKSFTDLVAEVLK